MLVFARSRIPRLFQPHVSKKTLGSYRRFLSSTTVPETSSNPNNRRKLAKGPSLQHFLANAWGDNHLSDGKKLGVRKTPTELHPYITKEMMRGDGLNGIIPIVSFSRLSQDLQITYYYEKKLQLMKLSFYFNTM
jgi:hypothetical protein